MLNTYKSKFTGIEIDDLLGEIDSKIGTTELAESVEEVIKRLQGTSANQDGYKDPIFTKEFVGSAVISDLNTWLDNQFFAVKNGVYYRNGQSGASTISKDVPQCLINISFQGVKLYVFNAPRSFSSGEFEQIAFGVRPISEGGGITWGSDICRRHSTYDFTTKKATWTAWEKINSDVDKSYVDTQLATKVDKVAGKGLSTNDYTTAEKTKLAGIETGANKTIVDEQLSTSSTNPVQNKAVAASLNAKVNIILGKGLSTNDYTNAEKNLVATIPEKADKTDVDTQLETKANTGYVNAQVEILTTALAKKVDKVSGKSLSTNDYTTAEKNLVATIPNKADKTYVDNKFARVDNAMNLSTEDMQYMGVAFDRDGYNNGVYDTSADVPNLSVGDSFDYTEGYDSRGSISSAITIYDGETIVASASGVTALLNKHAPGMMQVLTKSGADGICVYKCKYSSEEVYLYGYGAEYRIYKKPYVLELEGMYKKVDEISSNYVDASTFIAATNGLDSRKADKTDVESKLATKVDKVSGKGLSTNDFTFAYKSAAETLRSILESKHQTQNGVIDIVSNLCLGVLYESEERLQIGAYIPLANHYTFKHEIANRSGSYIELDCQTYFVNYYDSWSSIDRLRLYIRVPKNESYSEVLICGIEYDGKNYHWKVLDKFTDGGFEESDTDMIRYLFFPVSYTREQVKAINTTLSQKTDKTYVDAQLDTKVSKIAGKGLSTNDFSNDYKAKVDKYSAGVIYNYIDGLTYIYKSEDNIASAGVGDNIFIYNDERGNISNFFSVEAGSIIVCDNNPILEYVSPSQLCVLAVPDATGKCTYTNNTGSTREICVLVNSNARMEVSLSYIQTAIRDANEVAQKVENLANEALSQVALLIPESLSVEAPKRLTWGNKVTNYIKAVLAPINVVQNIIYISDNKAVEVGTDGVLTPVAKGVSRVHVIPTQNTALARTCLIEVGDPRLRISSQSALRFTQAGGLRLT